MARKVVFFQSTGIAHFRELVRLWLRHEDVGASDIERGGNWRQQLAGSPPFLASQVGPLIDGWRGIVIVNAPETWDGVGNSRRCTAAATLS